MGLSRHLKTYAITLMTFFILVISSCTNPSQEVSVIELNIDFVSHLTVNDTKLITVYSTKTDDTFTFISSNESIITVNQMGWVHGVSIGEATITIISSYGKKIDHTITVMPVLFVESIQIQLETSNTIYAGFPYAYHIHYDPEQAVNKQVRFSQSDPNVIIDELNQTITFIRAGKATLFAYLEDEWNIQSKIDVDVQYHQDTQIYDLLFIGNSLTKYTYDIPLMVKHMMEAEGHIVYIDYSTNFQYLDQHEINVNRLLSKQRYTHVILQEKSDGLITDLKRFEQSVSHYDALIKANGAKTVLYQTWTYHLIDLEARQTIHDEISLGYRSKASEIDALISIVGDVFMEMIINHPEINLYADLNHPSLYGAYASALVHYKTITGKNVEDINYRPTGISLEVESKLKGIVDMMIP